MKFKIAYAIAASPDGGSTKRPRSQNYASGSGAPGAPCVVGGKRHPKAIGGNFRAKQKPSSDKISFINKWYPFYNMLYI